MATRIEKCKWCNKPLIVPFLAQTVYCPSCRYVNYIAPATTQYNRYVNNGYYQQMIQQSPRPPVQSTPTYNNSYYQHPPAYNNGYYNQVSPPPLYNNSYYLQQVSPQLVYGRKRAVLCGVSYRNTPHSLDGSVTDVESMKRLLVDRMGFPDQSILVLTGNIQPFRKCLQVHKYTFKIELTPPAVYHHVIQELHIIATAI